MSLRVYKARDGWFFSDECGVPEGPYTSESEARSAFLEYCRAWDRRERELDYIPGPQLPTV